MLISFIVITIINFITLIEPKHLQIYLFVLLYLIFISLPPPFLSYPLFFLSLPLYHNPKV